MRLNHLSQRNLMCVLENVRTSILEECLAFTFSFSVQRLLNYFDTDFVSVYVFHWSVLIQ